MLTLEEHLGNCVVKNPEFEQLKSIWTLNKKNIPNAQSAINFNFPHYSLHESSHSNTIIKNVESFLGKERIEQLSPTDTWLILMAAYTHDLGMVVFNNVLEKKWTEEEFQSYLKKSSDSSSDKDLKKAAELLLNIHDNKTNIVDLKLPLEIRKAVILVTADYFRRNHHFRSKNIISGTDNEFYTYINGFNLTGIPDRFSNVLAEIAYSHGIEFYSVIDRLEYIADGFGNDKMYPRFIAFLLRLGDLLDVDDKRFNIFSEKVFNDSLPYTSQLHKEKHASVKHLLISPSAIEVTVDCKSDAVYRVAREWFDWLQKEVEDQSREWTDIAPKHLLGIPPVISRGKIKILYKSVQPKEDLMNLRFEISNKKVFEMFEGSAIYEKAGLVFFREVVQNAFDASKLQLWKFINSGIFDTIIRRHLKVAKEVPHEALINLIVFPVDLPDEVWEGLQIDLKILWFNENTLRVEVSDNGTGISEYDLIRMTKKVGESRSLDTSYQKTKKDIPYWLRPTGAFGIGLQSLFMVADNFIMQTKSDSEEAKEISFFSAKNGEYCRITNSIPKMSRGTKLIVDIPTYKFSEIFENSFSIDILEQYDIFNDKYGNIYLHKIIAHLVSEFRYVSMLNIEVLGERIKSSYFSREDRSWLEEVEGDKKIKRDKTADICVDLYKAVDFNTENNVFSVYENAGVGASYTIRFFNDFNDENSQKAESRNIRKSSKYLVRSIPVDESFSHFFKTNYCSIIWNFESQESDKILNISRSSFIENTKSKIDRKFLDEVFPKVIQAIVNSYEKHLINDGLIIEFFHLHITALMNNVILSSPQIIYKDILIPINIASNKDLSPIKYIDFFTAKRFLVINKNISMYGDEGLTILKETYSYLYQQNNYCIDIVVWSKEYLNSYFRLADYYKVEYLVYRDDNNDAVTYINVYEKSPTLKPILSNNEGRKIILNGLKPTNKGMSRRSSIFSLSEYWMYLSVNRDFDYYFSDRYELQHFIISPFTNSDDLLLLNNAINTLTVKNETNVKELIKNHYLQSLIPEKLIDFILDNSPNEVLFKRSRETVLSSYLDLMIEFFGINNTTTLE